MLISSCVLEYGFKLDLARVNIDLIEVSYFPIWSWFIAFGVHLLDFDARRCPGHAL